MVYSIDSYHFKKSLSPASSNRNKYSNRSMGSETGNYDRQTDRPTQTDMRVPWEVSLPITTGGFWEIEHQFYYYASHWRHHSCICTYKYMCEYIIHSQLSWCISPPSLFPHRNDNHSLLIIQLTCFIINHQEKSLSLRFNKSKS